MKTFRMLIELAIRPLIVTIFGILSGGWERNPRRHPVSIPNGVVRALSVNDRVQLREQKSDRRLKSQLAAHNAEFEEARLAHASGDRPC